MARRQGQGGTRRAKRDAVRARPHGRAGAGSTVARRRSKRRGRAVAGRIDRAVTLGVIGGSGLYQMEALADVRSVAVATPFGAPSDRIVVGRLGDTRVAFLPRHGRGHRFSPTELPFRANVYALKALGAETIIAVSAVGSLRAEIAPGTVVIPDQFIDRTRQRVSTFFGAGVVAHVGFADPICPRVAAALGAAATAAGARVHPGGTYVCMEGPQFSTRAESELYRSWGAHVIGMTNLQEAKLAREAEICFATIAMVTDYDCWKTSHADVDVQEILRVLGANVELAKRAIATVAPRLAGPRACGCEHALKEAIITDRAAIPPRTRRRLDLLLGKYLP
jgi:5'-methylthioadenosine phosphorylase